MMIAVVWHSIGYNMGITVQPRWNATCCYTGVIRHQWPRREIGGGLSLLDLIAYEEGGRGLLRHAPAIALISCQSSTNWSLSSHSPLLQVVSAFSFQT